MALQYTNRVGKTYHLREGKTKTGKPKYFFSTQQNGKGKAVNEMPEGYEIYERPENAQVFLRKKLSRLITDIEKQYVRNQLNTLKRTRRYIVDCKNKYITIYESNSETGNVKGIFGNLLNNSTDFMATRTNIFDQNYTAMLRFHLDDKEKRTFTVERFCFRGFIDDWIYLAGPDDFRSIINNHLKLLGTEAFFDSIY